MELVQHAKSELTFANLFSEKGDFYGGETAKAVMELMEVFSKQGHSGSSAPIVIDLFKRLANWETLIPITGNDDEWNEVSDNIFQNNRNSAIFKEDGRCYYIDGIIKQTPDGTCWSGGFYRNKEDFLKRDESKKLHSTRCYIKSFPFTPKKFYIKVEDVEVKPDDWEMYALNESELQEVEQYYNLK